MIYFFSMSRTFIITVSMTSVFCVILQSISVVFNLNRHRRGLTQTMEIMLDVSILLQVLTYSILIAQVSGDIRDSLILPSGYFTLRYILFGIISVLAASLSINKKSWLPSLSVFACFCTLPFVEILIGHIFPFIYVACLTYFMARSIYVCVARQRELQTSISGLSIKEAIDALQTGVLFCKPDGSIILINKQMQSLMILLTGAVWRNGIDFYNHITGDKLPLKADDAELDGRMVFRLKDKSVWMFNDTLLNIGAKPYHQITAANVTEKWDATTLRREQNTQLDIRQNELTKTIANLHTIYQKEEALKAKSRIHDVLGQQIALLIRSLREDGELDKTLLRAFSKDSLMRFATQEPTESAKSDLPALIKMMAGIGVKITVHGNLPDSIELAVLFTEIITEGVTNAIRHGFSKEIDISCKYDDGQWALIIQNNGSPPGGPITEGSGIAGIRRKLAAVGGTLRIETSPIFALKAVLSGGTQ